MSHARRIKEIRSRWTVKRWEFRQRNLAHGAWGRFREALAQAREAYAVDPAAIDALVGDGAALDPRGTGLEPARRIVWLSAERARALAGARRMAMHLDAEMLGARELVLVGFEIAPAQP
jgi:hypothetical protein